MPRDDRRTIMGMQARSYGVVTGAFAGIGYELAKCCVRDGYDLLVVADEPEIHSAATQLRQGGAPVEAIQADLAIATACRFVAVASAIGGVITLTCMPDGRSRSENNLRFARARNEARTPWGPRSE
jgi:short-subunit dehydrogenase